jgi:DNA-directed RNA polymerase subunit omega
MEDCLDNVTNPFELALLASHRARQMANGAEATVPRNGDKETVVALREIAAEAVSPDEIKESLIHSFQNCLEVDVPEEELPASANIEGEPGETLEEIESDRRSGDIPFGGMSEEELLAAIDGLEPPEKTDDDL